MTYSCRSNKYLMDELTSPSCVKYFKNPIGNPSQLDILKTQPKLIKKEKRKKKIFCKSKKRIKENNRNIFDQII